MFFPFCPRCGEKNKDDCKFCKKCGEELEQDTLSTKRLADRFVTSNLPENQTFTQPLLLHNRYKIIKTDYIGPMSYVYKAEDTQTNNLVAVKEMSSDYSRKEDLEYAVKRFKEEARILKNLSHHGIPEVIDYFTEGKNHYLVMAYVEGKDLDKAMKDNGNAPIDEGKAIKWFKEILVILDYLHSQSPPIIYRDMKPPNIMITQEDKVVLVDFGIARIFEPVKKGTLIGTPGFASPEQYKGYAEPRSDIYSLGVTMHYLLTGSDPSDPSHPPFSFRNIRDINPNVSPELVKLVMSMLDSNIQSRPETAKRLIDILEVIEDPNSPRKILKKNRLHIKRVAILCILGFFLFPLIPYILSLILKTDYYSMFMYITKIFILFSATLISFWLILIFWGISKIGNLKIN